MQNYIRLLDVQRRQRRPDHYCQVDKTILFAYQGLSDGAKLTYMALDSFDWIDTDGTSKGYVFPSQATLAKLRGISERTLRRQLEELVQAGLIRTEMVATAHGRRNIYVIRNSSDEEFERYLSTMVQPGSGEEVSFEADNGVSGELCASTEPPSAGTATLDLTKADIGGSMGADENDRYKDTKVLNKHNQKQDKTDTSGPVSVFIQNQHQEPVAHSLTVPLLQNDFSAELLPSRIADVFSDVMQRQASHTERAHLVRLVQLYDADEVETAIFELMVQRDLRRVQNPTRYLAGILSNWCREGRRTTDIVQHLRRVGERQVA